MRPNHKAELAEELRKNLAAIDDYSNSVRALYALGSHLTFDPATRAQREGTHFCTPRTMAFLDPDGTSHNVTPDSVIQLSGQYGVIAEMKKHFPATRPDATFEQIQKYDRPLRGWWTEDEKVGRHDLVLMTHTFSAVTADDAYKSWVERANAFERAFAIIEFGYQDQGDAWFLLRRREGSLSDGERDEALRKGVPIKDEILLRLFDKYKFSEQEPPHIYMLLLLHDYILPLFPRQEDYERDTGARMLSVLVTAEQLRASMIEQFCPTREARQPQVPRLDWVKRALETLERIGLATSMDRAQSQYRIALRKPARKDTVEYFTARLLQLERQEAQKRAAAQPELFGE